MGSPQATPTMECLPRVGLPFHLLFSGLNVTGPEKARPRELHLICEIHLASRFQLG